MSTDARRVLDELLSGALTDSSPFGATSRYRGLPLATVEVDGVPVRVVTRRIVPQPDALATMGERAVVEGDRIDNLAAAELGDAEVFWRIADANGALHPSELVAEVGRRLRITLPEGVPSPPEGA